MKRFERYVAIGDSSTEGLDDPDGRGGYRGWANRLAETIASHQGSLLYANLGVRGRRTRQIREEQLDRALALKPDLASVFAGTNDLLRREYDLTAVSRDLELMIRALGDSGATVITFTMPDLSSIMPVAHLVRRRLMVLNDEIRRIAAAAGAVMVDFAEEPTTQDRRFWSEDRLHANAAGHERMAIALAVALGYPPPRDDWKATLDPEGDPTVLDRCKTELLWGAKFLLPWLGRRLRGRSSGDAIQPKLPDLAAVRAGRELTPTGR